MLVQTFNGAVKITVQDVSEICDLPIAKCLYLFIPTCIPFDIKKIAEYTFIDTHVELCKQTLLPKLECPNIQKLTVVTDDIRYYARKLSSYSRLAKDPKISAELVEDIYVKWLQDCETFVYLVNKNVAGYISISGNNITMLYVRPEYQGTGVATELVRCIDQEDLQVSTLLSNKAAVNFYIKVGFVFKNTFNVFHYHRE